MSRINESGKSENNFQANQQKPIKTKQKEKEILIFDGEKINFEALSSALPDEVKEMLIFKDIIPNIDENKDEKITDKEILNWTYNQISKESKKMLPKVLRSEPIYKFLVALLVKNNDRTEDIVKIKNVLDKALGSGTDFELGTLLKYVAFIQKKQNELA